MVNEEDARIIAEGVQRARKFLDAKGYSWKEIEVMIAACCAGIAGSLKGKYGDDFDYIKFLSYCEPNADPSSPPAGVFGPPSGSESPFRAFGDS